MDSAVGPLLEFNWIIQAIFAFEIAVRILAHWPSPALFVRTGWNVFDLVVVAVAFLPINDGVPWPSAAVLECKAAAK